VVDDLTPIAVRALAQERQNVPPRIRRAGNWARYSFVGVASAAMLTAVDGEGTGSAEPADFHRGPAVAMLRDTVASLATSAQPGLPPFTSGYRVPTTWSGTGSDTDNSPTTQPPELNAVGEPRCRGYTDGTVTLIANAINFDNSAERVDEAWQDAVTRLDRMTADLAAAPATNPMTVDNAAEPLVRERTTQAEYMAGVEVAKEHIRAGDAFQIVLSQRFEVDCPASALDVYRVLRATNPSPYMYLLRLPGTDDDPTGWDIVGSSPEALVTVADGRAPHPIAGTRPRSADWTDAHWPTTSLPGRRAGRTPHVGPRTQRSGRVSSESVEVVIPAVERYSFVMHQVDRGG
jgi:anthranilate synthase component 1